MLYVLTLKPVGGGVTATKLEATVSEVEEIAASSVAYTYLDYAIAGVAWLDDFVLHVQC